ncbi:MAG TPA: OmpA family protein [Candidatus Acidoferrales bacterium]|nr:OmpA family protein [Candidatus Acidoferrales bacterium]
MKARILWLAIVGLTVGAGSALAEQGFIGGINGYVAAPVGHFDDRARPGGGGSLFAGYMFLDYLGLVGEGQFVGFDSKFDPNRAKQSIWAIGGLAGPRVALPFHIADIPFELNGTWEGGVFTGLNGDTPISRTSWGYSTGGGLDVRLSDDILLGLITRYNWIDQRTAPGEDVQYIIGGLELVYNEAAPPPPPAVAPPPPETVAEAAPVKKKIVLRGVNFDFGKATIRSDDRPVLDEAVATLQRESNVAIVAVGHTDDVGSDASNMKLSQRRAKSVRDYLVAGGIAPGRIRAEGRGEAEPVASNKDADGRAQNRRVELRVEGE